VVHVAVREEEPFGKEHFVAEAGANSLAAIKKNPIFAAQEPC
jgi:hypothetical protein